MNTALLLIDIQNDYFPGGKNELVNSMDAALSVKKILELFREKNLPVIHIQHLSVRPGSTFFIPETYGSEIHDYVMPVKSEKIFIKNFPNSFRDTGLLEYLQANNIKNLIICGMMTHMCVEATTRAAFDFGFNCIVLSDCCTTKNLSINDKIIPANMVHDSFLAALNGVYAKVMDSKQFVELSHNYI